MSDADAPQPSDSPERGVLRPPSGYGIGERPQDIGNPAIGGVGEILALGTAIKLEG